MPDLFSSSASAVKPSAARLSADEQDSDLPFSIVLDLVVTDRDVIAALLPFDEGEDRQRYTLEALKIGVLALRHVGGQATADLIQREVRGMQQTLEQHNKAVHDQLASTLQE